MNSVPSIALVDRLPKDWAKTIRERLENRYSLTIIYQVISQGIRTNDEISAEGEKLAAEHYDSLQGHYQTKN